MKRIYAIILTVCMMFSLCSELTPVKAAEISVTGKTAAEITSAMGFGLNIGNSLEATGSSAWNNSTGNPIYNQETSWGNPIITAEIFKAVKKKGFNCVRIPITWEFRISSDGSYTIDADWMNRVKEVVDYAYASGLYVIINTHHDSWTEEADLAKDYEAIGLEMNAVWSQISEAFADYDQRLIFEGMNEPTNIKTAADGNVTRDWTGKQSDYEAVNYLNQVFVDAVRSNGKGHNAERLLMIQGYAASSSTNILRSISIPTYKGGSAGNIAVSLHCYSPYSFCGSGDDLTFDYNSAEDAAVIDTIFDTSLECFLQYGIPVIIGEAGASDFGNLEARENWYYYMGLKAASYGTPMLLWDNGIHSQESESFGLINRNTYEWVYPSIINKLFSAKKEVTWGRTVSSYTGIPDHTSGYNSKYDTLVQYKSGVTHTDLWSEIPGTSVEAKDKYISSDTGADLMVVYTGASVPQLIFHAGDWTWICVSPSETGTATKKGKEYKLAFFSGKDIKAAINKENADNKASYTYEDNHDISFRTTGTSATIYEIAERKSAVISFRSNGTLYNVGTSIPSKPSWGAYTFMGWYLTPDYQEGSELTSAKLSAITADCTAYAKYSYSSSPKPKKTTVTLSKTSSGVRVKWTKVDGATGYIIYRATGNGSFKKVKTITNGSTVSWTDTGATKSGTRYRYKIVTYRKFVGKTYKSAASKIVAVTK